MVSRIYVMICLFPLFIVPILSGLPGNVSADSEDTGRYAIIIVFSPDMTDAPELNKSLMFYDHLLLEGYSSDDVHYLSDIRNLGVDASSNLSNIEGAFLSVIDSSDVDSEIVIYVSDHGHMVDNGSVLCFSDGNVSYSTIGSWMDEMDHSDLVYISGGNRSGLAGPELRGPEKTVICSMGADQVSFPDLFNITRGLEDPTSDINLDGKVSYHEAYLKECYNLRFSDQDPQYFSG